MHYEYRVTNCWFCLLFEECCWLIVGFQSIFLNPVILVIFPVMYNQYDIYEYCHLHKHGSCKGNWSDSWSSSVLYIFQSNPNGDTIPGWYFVDKTYVKGWETLSKPKCLSSPMWECWALAINICLWSFPITNGLRASPHPYLTWAESDYQYRCVW